MEEKYKVSIVIPVYNAESFLKECLDSVIHQTYKNIEVICVNDGSTDHSLDILNAYGAKDNRFHILSKENEGKGAASARNLGLDHATGDYILFLDSDDYYIADAVEKMVEKAERNLADLVIFNVNMFNQKMNRYEGSPKTIGIQYAPSEGTFSYKECATLIYQISDFIAWNKLYKRELIVDNYLRFEAIPISDDQYVPNLSVILAKRIVCIDEPLMTYRTHIGNSQVDFYTKYPMSSYMATYSVVEKLNEYGVYEEVKQSYLNCAIRLMREYFDKMDQLDNLKLLYGKFLNEVFPKLEALNLTKGFFYDERLWDWYELITSNSLEEILFQSARGYGSYMTSAILRFKFPYEKVKEGSRIVLVGKGLESRYWYAQLLLSGYADVVAWVDDEKDICKTLEYDEKIRIR